VLLVVLLTEVGDQVPVMLLVDVAGNVGTVAPSQKVPELPKVNVGVRIGLTVGLKLCVHVTPLCVMLTLTGSVKPAAVEFVGVVENVEADPLDGVVVRPAGGVVVQL
jgi:hypothetical protein